MRSPQDNPKGYRTYEPVDYAEGLRGDLFIMRYFIEDSPPGPR